MAESKRPNNQLKLEIDGPKITADKFARGVNAFVHLIGDVADNVADKRNALRWIVSVEPGSILIKVIPESDKAPSDIIPSTIKAIGDGIDVIENRAERPRYFSDNALKNVQELASILDGTNQGLESVKIWMNGKPNSLSNKSIANIKALLETYTTAIGSVEGKLEMITERGGLLFNVYDFLTDTPVKCSFKEELIPQITSAFGKRVSVYGVIKYRRGGIPISIQVENFRVLGRDKLPTFEDVRGILKD